MQFTIRWPTVFTLLTLAACGSRDGTATALNPPRIDTLAGGIVHVTNTGPTAWTDTNGWKLVQVAAINPADGSPGELAAIEALALGDDGSVYAFQRSPATIKAFGPDGKYRNSIGREGDGPGELRGGMINTRGDTIVVQDPNNHRLTLLQTNGTFIKSVQSTCCYWTTSLTIDSAGLIWSPGSVGKSGEGGWVRFRMDGTIKDTVQMPPTGETRESGKFWRVVVKNGSNSSSMMTSIPLEPSTWQILRADGAIIIGNTDRLSFVLLANGKDSSRVFEADAPRLPLSTAERDSIFEASISGQSEQWREALRKSASKDDLPAVWPAWTHAASDKTGRLWVSLPGARGDITRLVVFDTDGRLLGDVPLPSPKMFNQMAWSRDRLAFLDEDDEGRTVIRVFRVVTTSGK